jgi:hypothetical protein
MSILLDQKEDYQVLKKSTSTSRPILKKSNHRSQSLPKNLNMKGKKIKKRVSFADGRLQKLVTIINTAPKTKETEKSAERLKMKSSNKVNKGCSCSIF